MEPQGNLEAKKPEKFKLLKCENFEMRKNGMRKIEVWKIQMQKLQKRNTQMQTKIKKCKNSNAKRNQTRVHSISLLLPPKHQLSESSSCSFLRMGGGWKHLTQLCGAYSDPLLDCGGVHSLQQADALPQINARRPPNKRVQKQKVVGQHRNMTDMKSNFKYHLKSP